MNEYTVHAMVDGQKILISSIKADFYGIEDGALTFSRTTPNEEEGLAVYKVSRYEIVATFAAGMWSGVELVQEIQRSPWQLSQPTTFNASSIYDPIEQQGINDTAPHEDRGDHEQPLW